MLFLTLQDCWEGGTAPWSTGETPHPADPVPIDLAPEHTQLSFHRTQWGEVTVEEKVRESEEKHPVHTDC